MIDRYGFCVAMLLAAVMVGTAGADGPADAAAKKPEGLVEWSKTDFVHPPLKVMEPYRRITAFPVIAWSFHGRTPKGRYDFNEDYVRDLQQAGFNATIDDPRMLAPAKKVGAMMVMVVAFWGNQKEIIAKDFKEFGDPSSLAGFVLDDNCTTITRAVIDVSAELTKTHPHLVPFVSENPDPRWQSKTTVRVIGTQNYSFLRGFRGHWRRRNSYTHLMDFDRRCANAWNMSFWPLFGGHKNTPSQYRFQVLSALAYGAQGVIHFAYTPHRKGIWHPPENPFRKVAADCNRYAWQVVGRHTWGTRCVGVYHFRGNGDSPKGHLVPGADQPVVKIDDQLMAGALMVEKKFLAKSVKGEKKVPDYVMLVDKRTSRGGPPPVRDAWIVLGAEIPIVEVLDRASARKPAMRRFQPGCMVRTTLRGGDGLLLRANPPEFETALGGPQAAALYCEISRKLSAAQGTGDWAAIDAAVAVAGGQQVKFKKLLNTAVAAGTVSRKSAEDTLARLAESIDAIAQMNKKAQAAKAAKAAKTN